MRETANSLATRPDVSRRRRRASARARRAAVLTAALLALAPAGAYAEEAPGTPDLGSITDPLNRLVGSLPASSAPAPTPEEEASQPPQSPASLQAPELPLVPSPIAPADEKSDDAPSGQQQAKGPAQVQKRQSATAKTPADPKQEEPAVAVAADGGDAGSLCLQLPGSGGSAANADVVLLGQSVVAQLRDEAPELAALLGPCPDGATAGPGLSLDVVLPGVGEVCVRVDPDGAAGPLAATVSLLGHDLLTELAAAGLPIMDLVVPCEPKPDQDVDDDTQQTSPPPASVGSGKDGVDDATQASRKPAAAGLDRLPYTGSPVGALVAVGAVCVAGGGALLRRFRGTAGPA